MDINPIFSFKPESPSFEMSSFENKRQLSGDKPSKKKIRTNDPQEEEDTKEKSGKSLFSLLPSALIPKRFKKEKKKESLDENWVSATGVKNYLIRDPLLDFLNYHSKNLAKKKEYQKLILEAMEEKGKEDPTNFHHFLCQQGNEFEKKLILHLTKRFGSQIIDLHGSFQSDYQKKQEETIEAMKRGIPIIYSGVLLDSKTKTYGIPDLIVRSDWLRKLVEDSPIPKKIEKIGAPLLGTNYHYRIVDIKFTTLALRANGTHLLNAGYIPAYKGQLFIYNSALAQIQGYNPQEAYLLGRKWKYTTKGMDYRSPECLSRLGVVDFTKVDKDIPEKVEKALNWVRDMRVNGKSWNLFSLPLPRPELYPNMSNRADYPWTKVKEVMAAQIKEITTLWMCGTKERHRAHDQGIYQWTSKNCTPEKLGINSFERSRILTEILRINQQKKDKVLPLRIENNSRNWQKRPKIEFFVDFETINDIYPDFSSLPNTESLSMIFMIGLGYFDYQKKSWIQKSFTAENLTKKGERKICLDFARFIEEEKRKAGVESALIYHWSPAEVRSWEKFVSRFESQLHQKIQASSPLKKMKKLDSVYEKSGLELVSQITEDFFDLLEVFHHEPIVIQGCFSFGLKEVATTLYQQKLIKTIWDHNNPCANGPAAMVMAYRAYKNPNPESHPYLQQIKDYNRVDCQVLYEIIDYLRQHHC